VGVVNLPEGVAMEYPSVPSQGSARLVVMVPGENPAMMAPLVSFILLEGLAVEPIAVRVA
jgi:hypothetical protein